MNYQEQERFDQSCRLLDIANEWFAKVTTEPVGSRNHTVAALAHGMCVAAQQALITGSVPKDLADE